MFTPAAQNIADKAATDVLSNAHALANIKHAHKLYGALAGARLGKRLMISTRSDALARHPDIAPVLRAGGVSRRLDGLGGDR